MEPSTGAQGAVRLERLSESLSGSTEVTLYTPPSSGDCFMMGLDGCDDAADVTGALDELAEACRLEVAIDPFVGEVIRDWFREANIRLK